MTPNKTKSGLFETPKTKSSTPATPRVGKLGGRASTTRSEPNSTPPLQNSRIPVDRSPINNNSSRISVSTPGSPRSVNSRSTVEQRLPKTPTATARELPRSTKGAELNVAQEDLKKAKEQLVLVEKEKARALEDLKEAKKRAYDAGEKLTEALAAQKQAEECTEIEIFRAVELEQANIEAAQHKEEAWQKELESVSSQHALDVSSLVSTLQELETLRQELKMTIDAKHTATIHADEALAIAEVNAEKAGKLSEEITHLKAMLDSKLESKDSETAEQLRRLNSEIEYLRGELERAMEAEKKLIEMEILIEHLRKEMADAKKAESDAACIAEDWKKKTELLDVKVEEAIQSERSASESLASAVKKLEGCSASLHDAEYEIGSLNGKVELLEMEITRLKEDLNESDHHVKLAKDGVLEMEIAVEVLQSELRSMEEEKMHALDNEKKTASNLQNLLEEKSKLVNDLEISKVELKDGKKAMDNLASTLHEVTAEARESQERLSEKQVEFSDAKDKIKGLEHALKSSEERYEATLSKARNEIIHLKAAIERSEMEANISKSERNIKEKELVSSLKNTEEELTFIKGEMEKVVGKLKEAELEAAAAKEAGIQLLDRLEQAKFEASSAHEAAEEARSKSLVMKERLLDKENELQSIAQENDDLRNRENDALNNIKELSALLEEVTNKKCEEENGELSNIIEKDYDVVSRTTEFSDGVLGEFEVHRQEDLCIDESKPKSVNENGKEKHEVPLEVDVKKWETSKFVDKGLSPERDLEQETLDDEASSKSESESSDQKNGVYSEKKASIGSSPSKDHPHKKKSPLLHKFGKFLKKKNNNNQ